MTATRPDVDTLMTAILDAIRARLGASPDAELTLEFQPALQRVSLNKGRREAVLAPSAVEPDSVVLFGRPGGARVRSFRLPLTRDEVSAWARESADAALRWVEG
ncbi:MAG: hypothetical protein R3A52_28405 [Polyangiales bacterium]